MTSFDYTKYARKEKMVKLLFLWPALVILLFLIAYPFIMLIYYSFFNFSFLRPVNTRAVGFKNYVNILSDTYTWERFIFTFKYVILAVSIQFVAGFPINTAIPATDTCPESIETWIKMRAAALYENRESIVMGNMNELPGNFLDGLLDEHVLIEVNP